MNFHIIILSMALSAALDRLDYSLPRIFNKITKIFFVSVSHKPHYRAFRDMCNAVYFCKERL